MTTETTITTVAVQICELEGLYTDEAKTKKGAIERVLGHYDWDANDLTQVLPEFAISIPGGLSDRVDYALMDDGSPVLLIEAKKWGENLDGHYKQANGYYTMSEPRVLVLVLTDGKWWRFYADFDRPSVMDAEPFRTINICDMDEPDEEFMESLRRESFSAESMIANAEQERRRRAEREQAEREQAEAVIAISKWLAETASRPSDAFVELALHEVGIKVGGDVNYRDLITREFESMSAAALENVEDEARATEEAERRGRMTLVSALEQVAREAYPEWLGAREIDDRARAILPPTEYELGCNEGRPYDRRHGTAVGTIGGLKRRGVFEHDRPNQRYRWVPADQRAEL